MPGTFIWICGVINSRDVEKPQNGLYPRDVDSRCGYNNSEVTVEQYILTCVAPESMLDVAKLTVYENFLESLCAFDKNNKYCFYGFAGLADRYNGWACYCVITISFAKVALFQCYVLRGTYKFWTNYK